MTTWTVKLSSKGLIPPWGTPSRVMALRRKAIQARWINPSAGTPQPATRRHHQTSELTESSLGSSASVGALGRLLEVLQLGFGELPRAFYKLQPTHWGAMIVPQRQVPSESPSLWYVAV